MAKLENSLKNMFLSLTVISLIVGGLLGAVAHITSEPIAAATAAAQKDAIKAVTPAFDAVSDPYVVEDCGNGLPATIFAVSKDGQQVGSAVEVVTKKGFGGKVKVMMGFDMEGNITGYNVGVKGTGVIGKNPGKANLTVTKDGGEVDAITAATISTRAFCDAIALAYATVTGTDANTGATGQVKEAVEEAAETVGDMVDAIQSEE